MERWSEVLGEHVRFADTAGDRLVLNGYRDRLRRPENISHCCREVVGGPAVTPEVLMRRTAPERSRANRSAAGHAIPLLAAPKDRRQEDGVAPYSRRCKGAAGVAAIRTSTEAGRTCVSDSPRSPPSGGDAGYRLLPPARKRSLPDYCSRLAPVLGPMSLRGGTVLPCTPAVFLTGHAFRARELTRVGVRVRQDDHAVRAVDDRTARGAAAERRTPRLLEQRGASRGRHLAPRFGPAERAAAALPDRSRVAQLELATEVLSRRSAPLKALFRRAPELGILRGGAERTTPRFGRRITARSGGKLQTGLARRHAGRPSLRSDCGSSFVTQSAKGDRRLRTETGRNTTDDVGIGRRRDTLPALQERMPATNRRYPDAQAEGPASTVDAGARASLARPVQVGARRVPGVKLEDDRAVRRLEVPLQPGPFVAAWTGREVPTRLLSRHRLAAAEYRLSQLRADPGQRRAHGPVERLGTRRRSHLTPRGLTRGLLPVKPRSRRLGPLASRAVEALPRRPSRHPSAVEAAFRRVDAALDHLCATPALTRAG